MEKTTFFDDFKVKKRSYCKDFAKEHGGKWKYDGEGTWWCDDEKRYISRVRTCSCDDDICTHGLGSRLCLYGEGIPKWL
jgi:hypothetical protein